MPNNTGTLYIVATPIGNLEDITYRAVRILGQVDAILCEDTRQTNKLLQKYSIKNKTISYNSHTTPAKNKKIIEDLLAGKNLALVSDAGTPGVSDPGSYLVNYVRTHAPNVAISPIPGASAVTALVSVSGLTGNNFTFWGFVPQKKGRETFLKALGAETIPVIFYESSHRIVKLFEWLVEYSNEKKYIVGRELTKTFETVQTGSAVDILNYLQQDKKHTLGEFVILVI